MFKIGDLIIYSAHGVCRVDDICEKTFIGVTKKYYVLHPMENSKLTISTPVDNDKVTMSELMTREEAEMILESFRQQGAPWIEIETERNQTYSDNLKTGNRRKIAMIANTLMREKIKMENEGRKFREKDSRLLTSIEKILFSELALSLNTTYEAINEKVLEEVNM